jgi:CHAT domain-containing protein
LGRELPRIFWCPTGPFTSLPIHAAGLYGSQGLDRSNCALYNWAVSSYTPTLSALIKPSHPDVATNGTQLLAIVQPSVPGQAPLPGTLEELKCIQARMKRTTNVSLTSLKGPEATVDSVLEKMKMSGASWVHFACHGVQDIASPADSGMMLSDGRLKLSDIINVSRVQGGLAFLSACQTATVDKALSDEAIHFAAGMLLAGYEGVIATMWSIKDSDAPLVVDKVYDRLFQNHHDERPDYRNASRALHDAVQSLRARNEKSYLSWVPFIHIGI